MNKDNFMFAVSIEQENFVGRPFFNLTLVQRHYKRTDKGVMIKNFTDI